MAALKIKKGDRVVVRSGSLKGRTGVVVAALPAQNAVLVEGLQMVKRHVKPSTLNPRGGTKDVHVPISVGKVALVADEKTNKPTRVGFTTAKDGAKVRVARALKNKEIK